jgi:hypothetical protein
MPRRWLESRNRPFLTINPLDITKRPENLFPGMQRLHVGGHVAINASLLPEIAARSPVSMSVTSLLTSFLPDIAASPQRDTQNPAI